MREHALSQWHEFRIIGILALALILIAITGSMMSEFPMKFILLTVAGAFLAILTINFPEVLLALFLNAGELKNDPRFQFPIDLTLLLWILTILSIYFGVKKGRIKLTMPPLKMAIPFLFICIMAFISLMYTNNFSYGSDKAIKLATLGTLALFGSFYIMGDYKRVRNFMLTYIIIAIAIIIDFIQRGDAVANVSITSNYLTMGASMAYAFIMVFLYFFMTDKSLIRRALYLLVFSPATLYVLMLSGGRGPFIALIVTMFFALTLGHRGVERKKIRIWLLIVIAVSGIYLSLDYQDFTRMTSRMMLFDEGGGRSVLEREWMAKSALKAVSAMPYFFTGLGIGGFTIYYEGLDEKGNMFHYPHDVLLEMWAELGIFGLVSIVLFLYWSIRKGYSFARKTRGEDFYTAATIFSVYFFTILNALKSGDINDHRFLFSLAGIIYALDRKTWHVEPPDVKTSRRIKPCRP